MNELVPGALQTRDYIDKEERFGAHNYHPLDLVIESGQGVWLYDVEGRRYMDFLSAYSSVNQGHCHPRILEALKSQAERVTITSRAFRNDQLPLLYEELHALTGFDRVLPMNTGAEAIETAIKAARKWGYKVKGIPENQAEIVVCANNFHGRTTTIVGFSTEESYKDGFGPFTPGFRIVPFGDLAALEAAITPNTCAFLIEPIQAEAGIYVPPAGYMAGVSELLKKHDVLFIADEIQTGLGRTGKLFAYEHEGIRPDVLVLGKALSGGFYPVSAMLASDEVMGVFQPGQHGSTFGGNPLACAVARAALSVLTDEGLVENSAKLGDYFMDRLRSIKSPHVKEVRGRGLLIGIELNKPARVYCERLMDEGLLCKETHDTVIRLAPPLIVSKEEIDWALERLDKVLSA
ncbi:MAG TPA: ornithine--oxo-acid transaminase [Pantanalinema sp.]